jgi:uncharacterized membrane protein
VIWLILGLSLWISAHLFKRVLPTQRAAMGKRGLGLVAALVLAGIVLMVIGYRRAEVTDLYALPYWVWHLNNLLMLVAIFLLDAGRAGGVVAAKLRHPMLWGVVVWAVAHLVVNGDLASLVLFGGLGLWALSEMVIINRAAGLWSAPPEGPLAKDVRTAVFALVIYAAIVGVHYWLLGYSVIAVFP